MGMLGLKKTLNLLVDYDPLWESGFTEQRKRIADALGDVATDSASCAALSYGGYLIFLRLLT
jgi:hypothetical protein